MRDIFIITRCIDLICRKSSTLIFDSIRIGFPTSNIICFYLGNFKEVEDEIVDKCAKLNIEFKKLNFKFNYEVIEWIIINQNNNFVVVDSDIIFHKNLEWYNPEKLIAGRYIPRYYESFINGFSEERLHTSLIYFSNISKLKEQIDNSFEQKTEFTPYNVFKPFIIKYNGNTVFYDSCCNLYHAIGGEAFGKDVLECYDHLFTGSFFNKVEREKPGLRCFFDSVFADIKQAKECYRNQNKYWYSKVYNEIDEIFNQMLPNDARQFILNYVNYIELIDDSIDNNDVKLVDDITEKALKLFSSNYWTKNSPYLALIEQMTHVLYFNSITWEQSSIAWKRREAKAISHCGYLMPLAIFLFETKNMKQTKELALKLMERSHLAHMEDLTHEEHIS